MNLDKYIQLSPAICREPNLTPRFEEADLDRIGKVCWNGYNEDENSRRSWLSRTQAAMDLAMQLQEDKSFPWPNCSNVAFPLVTIAALQFHARAYPTLFAGPDLVKYRVPGVDKTGELTQRARLVARYMSYQCLDEDEAFEEQHDRLLLNVPIVGCAFVKTRHDDGKGHNTSSLILARDFVLNYYAKSVDSCQRKTQIIPFYRNEIHEKCVAGTWKDIRKEPWYAVPFLPPPTPNRDQVDAIQGTSPPPADDITPILFGEQHTWLDLDNDGYAEPYIVTFDLVNHKVVRIVARWERPEDVERIRGEVLRIRATEYYTKYGLIPAPDGSIYDTGFGLLLGPLNESVNTIVNQLIDAGTMAVAAGGFLSRGVKIRGGAITFQPFGWQRVDSTGEDLQKGIFPYPVREPSAVLFQLLSLLINYTQRISGSGDTLVGENPGQNTPANNMNVMVEQGMKIYSATFKRMWRSMRDEFRKLFILNGKYLPESVPFGEVAVAREMFLEDPSKLVPAADPNVTTESMRMAQAAAIKQGAAGVPGYNPEEVERNWLRANQVDNIDVLYPGMEKFPGGQDPKVSIAQMKDTLDRERLEFERQAFGLELLEESRVNNAKIMQLEAQAANLVAEAGTKETDGEIALLNSVIGALKTHNETIKGKAELLLKKREIDVKATKPAATGSK